MKYTFIAFLFLVNQAFAGDFSYWGTIKQTYTGSGWTMIAIEGEMNNPDGCERSDYYAITTSHSNYNGILSSVLSAQMANKKVSFWLSGCGGQGNKYPRLTSIKINS